jgi:hypothetical protein
MWDRRGLVSHFDCHGSNEICPNEILSVSILALSAPTRFGNMAGATRRMDGFN